MSGSVSLPLRSLIRENISVVLGYAYSRQPLTELVSGSFLGEWDNLRETVLDFSRHRAERALLELALLLRLLDDQEDFGAYVAENSRIKLGQLVLRDGSTKDLAIRDVSNKVIHAAGFEWVHTAGTYPQVVCFSSDSEKWAKAEVFLVPLAAICGNFAR